MFGFFTTVEQLSTAIKELVAKLTLFSTDLTSTLRALVTQISELVENVNSEISDDVDEVKVTSILLENGTSFGVSTLVGDNGLLTITTVTNGVVETHITNLGFVAKL